MKKRITNQNHAKCLSCNSYYALNPKNVCILYSEATNQAGCYICKDCTTETTCNTCTGCLDSYFFSNGTCIACYTKLGGTCLFCSDGEQNGQKCTECNKENCAWCANNKSAPNCERCLGSNYLENGDCKACNKKYGSNCVVCNSNNCLSCAQGYHLSADKKSCVANNGAWNCSEENFMQIGDICVTRKNMGDASILKINSSDVTIVKYGETCYSASASCC